MKKFMLLLMMLFAASSLLADTGQLRVFRVRHPARFPLWVRYHRPQVVVNQQQFTVNNTVNSTVNHNNVVVQPPAAPEQPTNTAGSGGQKPGTDDSSKLASLLGVSKPKVTKPYEENEFQTTDEGRGGGFFKEGVQQAFIAWNGKEEILVLSTQQQYPEGESGAVVSFLPLSGKPIDIYKSSPKTFDNALKKIEAVADASQPGWKEKYRGGRAGGFSVLFRKDIGAHNITVIEVLDSNVDTFYQALQDYITKNFGEDAAADIGDEAKAVFAHYITNLHFKYFAVDVQEITKDTSKREKEAIAYHFESPQCYFPLYVSRLGGSGETQVRLAVVTPDKKLKFTGYPSSKLGLYTPTVKLSPADVKGLDDEDKDDRIFRLLSGSATSALQGRVWLIDGILNQFDEDFVVE